MRRFYCTCFDRNYLPKALALTESLCAHEGSNFQLLAVCLDEISRLVIGELRLPNVVCIPLHQIEGNDTKLLQVQPRRTLEEYYWTLTPTIILWILENLSGIEVLTYLDADLFFFSPPDPIFRELAYKNILIHEHRFAPSLSYLEKENGKYNVGLLCFRNNKQSRSVLQWWRERCLEWCYRRFEDGKMGDQMYLNDWVTRFQNVAVLQNIGGGVAPWNHERYSFTSDISKQVNVNNFPVLFYHFQSLGVVRPGVFVPAKHASYALPENALRLCYLPYVESLDRAYVAVRNVLKDFDFGSEGEGILSREHTLIARREFRGYLQDIPGTQSCWSLDQDWDCYSSPQLRGATPLGAPVPMNRLQLWSPHRKVLSEDDLLLELQGIPVCEHIAILYVIGAHLFQERDLLLRIFSHLQQIYLFEPNPAVCSQLKTKFQGNPMVQVFPYAISDTNGRSQFYLTNNGASSSLLPLGSHRRLFPHVSVEATISVETRKLESLISEYSLPLPDMLFLDVQGAESKIISSLSADLRSHLQLIYTEASREEVYVGSKPLEHIQSLLASDFIFLGFAPLTNETPTHGNALFANRSVMMGAQVQSDRSRHVLNRTKNTQEGQALGTRSVERPETVTRCLLEAETSFKEKNYQVAASSLAYALNLLPDDPELLVAYGNLLLRLGDIEAVKNHFRKATLAAPLFAPAYTDLAAVLLSLGNGAEATAVARRALALDPENLEAQQIISSADRAVAASSGVDTLVKNDDSPRKERSREQIDLSVRSIEKIHLQAFRSYEKGDWATALVYFDEALSRDPARQGVNFVRGQCLLNLGRLEQAEQAILSELVIKPDHPDASRLLSEIRARQTEWVGKVG